MPKSLIFEPVIDVIPRNSVAARPERGAASRRDPFRDPRLIPVPFNNSGIRRELDEACKHKRERVRRCLWLKEEGVGTGKGFEEQGMREEDRGHTGYLFGQAKYFSVRLCR